MVELFSSLPVGYALNADFNILDGLIYLQGLQDYLCNTLGRGFRALRSHVVLRKILGTLCNDKGTAILKRIMTILATWGQNVLDNLQMLTAKVAN